MMNKDYDFLRAELWKDVFVAYASASNSTNSATGFIWADKAVEAFDQRFKEKLEDKEANR